MKLRIASAIAVLVCSLAAAPPAPPTLPDTPQGKRMAALLAAFDAGTPDAIRAFIAGNLSEAALAEIPLDQRVQRMSGIANETGRLELARVVEPGGSQPSFLAHAAKSGDWLEVKLTLEEAPPQKIRALRFDLRPGPDGGGQPGSAPGDARPGSAPGGAQRGAPPAGGRSAAPPETRKSSDAEAAAAAKTRMKELAAADKFSGVVLMAKDGRPFLLDAVGLADRAFAVPNRTDTRFNIGSINKVFTQVAIAQLAAEGKLALGDTIRKHLPDSKIPEADRITIQQLLTMTSGMGDFFGERFEATPKDRVRTLRDYLSLFETDPLKFAPGTGRGYSNAGYVVLGLIVEKASGRDYFDYVRERIFAPAGMKSTDASSPDAVVPNLAVGYTRDDPKAPWRSNVYGLPGHSSSAGGGYSTAEDLLAFDRALRGDKLLPPEWTEWFFGNKSQPAPSKGAPPHKHSGGLGFAGGTGGANAVVEMDLDTGYTIVVLANQDPPAAEELTTTLRQWLGLQ
ncbi:MAG TPA: serine hydrolase domain-containing protein [Thermoanaerobaculia bacterium]|jgi:CubicO group peptidase (beta-lactamase class C family)|nr:serine hydrolase domain-containing protein [Thermoanaerobaculia bacterium]